MGRMNQEDFEKTQPVSSKPVTDSQEVTQVVKAQSPGALDETRPVLPAQPDPEATQPSLSEETRQAQLPLPGSDFLPPALEPPSHEEPRKRSRGWILWAFLALLLLTLIAASSGYSGYLSAIQQRTSYQLTQVAGDANKQFELGLQDLQAGRYDLARQRFEYVIQLDPDYPGVTAVLAEALLRSNATATATIAPTPTLTPTPDLRGREELYAQAQQLMVAGDWTNAIDTLLILRKKDPEYQAVKVDGLLFVALRNRGIDKISRQADLEGGTYDLTLASRFGPLDVEASNWRTWAEMYIRGASFWGVDWANAVYYFSQLAPVAPNLMDTSFLTASERYYQALIGYGDWFASQELWCEASEQYQAALNLRTDPNIKPTAEHVEDLCANPTFEPPPPSVGTPTPTPTGGSGEVTPLPTSTETLPLVPTPTETLQPPTLTPTPTDEPTAYP